MRYDVEGADTVSGAMRLITVEADDERLAEAAARDEGLLVSSIFEASALSPAEKLDLMVGQPIERPLSPLDPAQPQPLPAPIMYLSPTTESSGVPEYVGLKIASIVLFVLAVLAYAMGALMMVISMISLFGAAYYRPSLAASALTLMASTWPIFVGAMSHALSAACTALRDIARNSFR